MQEDIKAIDISVISDFHLATHASKAKSLLKYLKSIHPKTPGFERRYYRLVEV